MRDWRYYVAKTWMTTLYTLLVTAFLGLFGFWLYWTIMDPGLRAVAIAFILIAFIWASLALLFKLTRWSEKIIERDKNGRN
jgi:hypothetical protein